MILTTEAPRIFKSLPIVSNFYLITVLDKLLEKTILITNAVTVERYFHSSGTVEIASCKTAKTAVTESCIVDIFKYIDVNALFLEHLLYILKNTEAVKVVVHHSTHKKFSREVVSSALAVVLSLACCPVVGNFAHNSLAERKMKFGRCKLFYLLTIHRLCCKLKLFHNIAHLFSPPVVRYLQTLFLIFLQAHQ